MISKERVKELALEKIVELDYFLVDVKVSSTNEITVLFDNEEGEIIHVGILLDHNHIIHSHGKVRIDQLDHSGIFNIEKQKHTHKLRVIKRMI